MKRSAAIILFTLIAGASIYYFYPRIMKRNLPILAVVSTPKENKEYLHRIKLRVSQLKMDRKNDGYSPEYTFLIDMSIPSGRKRFFVYDLVKDSIINAGLVAHGSCNDYYLDKPGFSNVNGSGCSSIGKYKVGYKYNGRFGKAYKLYGNDSTNSNAYKRAVVLHGYECVPDKEVHPQPICNSLGCPMISYKFLDDLEKIIDRSTKPILLWIY